MTDSRQNRVQSFAFVISAFASLCFAYFYAHNLTSADSARAAAAANLENQINPNIATIESLVRLPDIGLSRAEALIRYRKSYTENNIDRQAFENFDDLQNIKGIGPKTVQNMSKWLKFDSKGTLHGGKTGAN